MLDATISDEDRARAEQAAEVEAEAAAVEAMQARFDAATQAYVAACGALAEATPEESFAAAAAVEAAVAAIEDVGELTSRLEAAGAAALIVQHREARDRRVAYHQAAIARAERVVRVAEAALLGPLRRWCEAHPPKRGRTTTLEEVGVRCSFRAVRETVRVRDSQAAAQSIREACGYDTDLVQLDPRVRVGELAKRLAAEPDLAGKLRGVERVPEHDSFTVK